MDPSESLIRILIDDGSRLGSLVVLAYLLVRVTGKAYKDAAETYKDLAKEKQEELDAVKVELNEVKAEQAKLWTALEECKRAHSAALVRETEQAAKVVGLLSRIEEKDATIEDLLQRLERRDAQSSSTVEGNQ